MSERIERETVLFGKRYHWMRWGGRLHLVPAPKPGPKVTITSLEHGEVELAVSDVVLHVSDLEAK